ncbi:uroporphyrinogen-III synthase [Acidobacteria bacterium AH-259-A15]|nr:uroporphyrinogen-III synthase [Acidobacteria bacterium AH-259-A15]
MQDRTILITRSQAQAFEFRRLLEKAGAKVLEVPTIEIRPAHSPELDSAIMQLGSYDWLMFTSVNGVEIFMQRAQELGQLPAPEDSALPRICTIGPATARKVESYGYLVELIPKLYQAEGVLQDFLRFNQGQIKALRILLPRARKARELLPKRLREQGAEVDLIPVYDTVVPKESRFTLAELLRSESPDLITFTSSSTVRNFVTLTEEDEDLKRYRYAAIGPITAATAHEYGLDIVVQAEKFSIPDLVAAIGRYFGEADSDRR